MNTQTKQWFSCGHRIYDDDDHVIATVHEPQFINGHIIGAALDMQQALQSLIDSDFGAKVSKKEFNKICLAARVAVAKSNGGIL